MVSFFKKIFNSIPNDRKGAGTNPPRRVYLDNAGATKVGERAKRALIESLDIYGNPSGIHHEGAKAGQLLDKARALCATVLNAHSYEIYFVSSGTESCNLAVMGTYEGYRSQTVRRSDSQTLLPHMIVSSIEHPAILEPVKQLEREGKVRVTYLPVTEEGLVKLNDIREALCDQTILVSVMYANNEIGTIQPVKEVGRAIDEWKREKGLTFASYPYFHTDACQAANYCNVDVLRLKCHLMTVNSSKVYGPKGIALLYKREGIKASPVTLGGGQERELRSGTEAVALAYSFGTALEEASELRISESHRLRELRDYAREELTRSIPTIIFYGGWDEIRQSDSQTVRQQTNIDKDIKRLPNNINCRVPRISSEEMILRLDAQGFAVSHKSACASLETEGSYVVMALGATEEEAMENIRISLGRDTSKKDIDGLVQAIQEISTKYIH